MLYLKISQISSLFLKICVLNWLMSLKLLTSIVTNFVYFKETKLKEDHFSKYETHIYFVQIFIIFVTYHLTKEKCTISQIFISKSGSQIMLLENYIFISHKYMSKRCSRGMEWRASSF
jgi:hypothetical protein